MLFSSFFFGWKCLTTCFVDGTKVDDRYRVGHPKPSSSVNVLWTIYIQICSRIYFHNINSILIASCLIFIIPSLGANLWFLKRQLRHAWNSLAPNWCVIYTFIKISQQVKENSWTQQIMNIKKSSNTPERRKKSSHLLA